MRWSLFSEILTMSWETGRDNKLRSALTVLGVVIGIMSIVGMTSLLRGFDQSLRDAITQLGPDTITVAKFSGVSLSSGAKFQDLLMRPNLTPGDALAIERNAPSIEMVDITLGNGGPGVRERVYYKNQKTKMLQIFGTTERWPSVVRTPIDLGRFFTSGEAQRRRNVIVLGQTAYSALFPTADPIGKTVRLGIMEYTVIGVCAK